MFAEVEFSSIEESEQFLPPTWLGCDISFDKRFDNTFLSSCDCFTAALDPNS